MVLMSSVVIVTRLVMGLVSRRGCGSAWAGLVGVHYQHEVAGRCRSGDRAG